VFSSKKQTAFHINRTLLNTAMSITMLSTVPKSPLALFVKNTFFDIEDECLTSDPRRSSSEPPSCRHAEIDFKQSPRDHKESKESSDTPESTECSVCGSESPRGSVSDATSDDGALSVQSKARWCDSDVSSGDALQLVPVSPSTKTALNADAVEWTPVPMMPLLLGIIATMPSLFRNQFQDLWKFAEGMLSGNKQIKAVRSFEGPGLWGEGMTIVGTMCAKDIANGSKDEALSMVQHGLLLRAAKSKNAYVLGYRLMPFTPTEHGSAGMIAGLLSDGYACQDMLTQGFCSQGGLCSRRHPACMIPIYIEIKEEVP